MSLPFDPFSQLEQLQRVDCRNGLSYFDLAMTAFNVFAGATGSGKKDLADADRAPWESVAGKAASIIDLPESEQATLEISAKQLAKALYIQYTIDCDRIPNWEDVPAKDKVAWEAVGRHLANLIDSDGQGMDFLELEEKIIEWAKDRITPEQLVLS